MIYIKGPSGVWSRWCRETGLPFCFHSKTNANAEVNTEALSHFVRRRDAGGLRRRLFPQRPPRGLEVQTVFLVSREHLPRLPDPEKILLTWWSMSILGTLISPVMQQLQPVLPLHSLRYVLVASGFVFFFFAEKTISPRDKSENLRIQPKAERDEIKTNIPSCSYWTQRINKQGDVRAVGIDPSHMFTQFSAMNAG